jgi:hypothetical protein
VVSDLIDANPTTFAVYQLHVSDPPYDTAWGDERKAFYDNVADGIPWFAYDGLWDAWPVETYETKLHQRQAVPTDVTIDLSAAETGNQTYDVTARVCVEPGGIGRAMRVYMVHALDKWPLVHDSMERNTLRQGATTQGVRIAPGSCADVTRTFVFDATSWAQQSDIRIIAWAQTRNDSYPAEVYQAKVMSWPFPVAGAIFSDGFESGSASRWSAVVP